MIEEKQLDKKDKDLDKKLFKEIKIHNKVINYKIVNDISTFSVYSFLSV